MTEWLLHVCCDLSCDFAVQQRWLFSLSDDIELKADDDVDDTELTPWWFAWSDRLCTSPEHYKHFILIHEGLNHFPHVQLLAVAGEISLRTIAFASKKQVSSFYFGMLLSLGLIKGKAFRWAHVQSVQLLPFLDHRRMRRRLK